MADEVEAFYPDAQELVDLKKGVRAVSLSTQPEGANLSVKDYQGDETDWILVGQSPLEALSLNRGGFCSLRAEKEGYGVVERIVRGGQDTLSLRLDWASKAPAGMVGVEGGEFAFRSLDRVHIDDFWLDRYEVANEAFKKFVDAGGYANQDYWKYPIEVDGRVLSWEESRGLLVDTTGRPGPSGWELGSFPEGKADEPVRGVSWYEAAAYAEFAGKSLPTVYHWWRGAVGDIGPYFPIQAFSNFGGDGPASVGEHRGMGAYGHYDMAGNVKEWCWNEDGTGKRYILGGAWNEPSHQFTDPDAQPPLTRASNYGLRLAKYPTLVEEALESSIARVYRDYSLESPVSDEVFEVFRSLYAYDASPLNASVESVDETSRTGASRRSLSTPLIRTTASSSICTCR